MTFNVKILSFLYNGYMINKKNSKNDLLLDKYIEKKIKESKKIPYMTSISQDTNISIATISRYAKRKGFYSFAEMRAFYNKSKKKKVLQDYGLIKEIENSKSVIIITSKFTKMLGVYLRDRLNYLRIKNTMIDKNNYEEIENVSSDSLVIAFSISLESLFLAKALNKLEKNKKILITSVKYKKAFENVKTIELTQFNYENDYKFEGFDTLRNIYLWLDDCLNSLHLKQKK